jgi:hypothetical protein
MSDHKGKVYTEGDVQLLVAQGVAQGRQEGLIEGLRASIDWLEKRYIEDEGRPDRDTPKGKAILELARDCGAHLREELLKK